MARHRHRLERVGAATLLALISLGLAASTAGASGGLRLHVTLAGSGTVKSANGALHCPSACSSSYPADSFVTLTATPAAEWGFQGWTGACFGSASACTIAVQAAATVQATFTPLQATVNAEVGGPGEITSSPAGISCGVTATAALDECSATFSEGTTVTLTTTAAPGGVFAVWGAGCQGMQTSTCTVILNSASTDAEATFGHQAPAAGAQPLTTTSSLPQVPGTLSSDPNGISCSSSSPPASCGGQFASGSFITLAGAQDWGGACLGVLTTCTVDVDTPTNVVWMPFSQEQMKFGVNITVSGPGSVIVKGPPKMTCTLLTGLCDSLAPIESKVQLTAVPSNGKDRLGKWTGSCTGSKSTCSIVVVQPANVRAAFEKSHQ